jgi:hypothetical protein
MAYRGKLAPGEFAKMAPNHPFAGIQITFGVKRSDVTGSTKEEIPIGRPSSPTYNFGIIAPSDGTVLSPSLVQTYRNTDYRVGYPPSFVLHIGQYSPELVAEHSRHNVKSSLFITASNPYGKLLDPAVNFSRYTLLLGDLRIQNLIAEEASGQHPSGNWPAERSLIVYGVDLKLARELGASHNQNAVVWTDSDGIPKLILLR